MSDFDDLMHLFRAARPKAKSGHSHKFTFQASNVLYLKILELVERDGTTQSDIIRTCLINNIAHYDNKGLYASFPENLKDKIASYAERLKISQEKAIRDMLLLFFESL